jgi:hypothetical protein
MSTPTHDNEVVLVGEVREVPVMFPEAQPGVSVGNRLWVRGRLACEPVPNRPESLLFVQARWVESVTRPGQT